MELKASYLPSSDYESILFTVDSSEIDYSRTSVSWLQSNNFPEGTITANLKTGDFLSYKITFFDYLGNERLLPEDMPVILQSVDGDFS